MNRGFIKSIILIIVALAALYYFFGFNIADFVKTPKFIATWEYIKDIVSSVWNDYIAGFAGVVWDNIVIIVDLAWDNFMIGLEKIKGFTR